MPPEALEIVIIVISQQTAKDRKLSSLPVYGDKIFEKPGQGGTAGGNGGKPAEKGGKLPEFRRESLISEIDSQLSCPKMAPILVGVFFFAPRGQRRPHINVDVARWALAQLNRKTPGKPRKNGNPGTFLDGRNGRGPLGHAPEVTAAVP